MLVDKFSWDFSDRAGKLVIRLRKLGSKDTSLGVKSETLVPPGSTPEAENWAVEQKQHRRGEQALKESFKGLGQELEHSGRQYYRSQRKAVSRREGSNHVSGAPEVK